MPGSLESFKSKLQTKSLCAISKKEGKPIITAKTIEIKVEIHYVKNHCSFLCSYDSAFHPACQLFKKIREKDNEGFTKRLKECIDADN